MVWTWEPSPLLIRLLYYYYITMKKLLNLLNEYECYRNGYDICTWWQERDGRIVWVTDDPRPQVRSEYYILSKEFWFIKWLVENDKIDREQFYDKARKIITDFDLRWEYEWACNEIITLLSISDTPIEDLISYLK